MSRSARGRAKYANLPQPLKRAVQRDIFKELEEMLDGLDAVHDRGKNFTDELAAIRAFVNANSGEFTPAERNGLTTAINDIRQKVATYADAVPGVSATYTPI